MALHGSATYSINISKSKIIRVMVMVMVRACSFNMERKMGFKVHHSFFFSERARNLVVLCRHEPI